MAYLSVTEDLVHGSYTWPDLREHVTAARTDPQRTVHPSPRIHSSMRWIRGVVRGTKADAE